MAILCGAQSIRDVIAFPKSSEGRDLMSKAPASITQADRDYYNLSWWCGNQGEGGVWSFLINGLWVCVWVEVQGQLYYIEVGFCEGLNAYVCIFMFRSL